LEANADEAEALLPVDHWDVAMVVAVVTSGPKDVASTGGMVQTKRTSPYYPAWHAAAPGVYAQVKAGVLAKDFDQVAEAMEHSTRLMHATMFTSLPPVLYLKGPTVELMHSLSAERKRGNPVAYTMDAGPNVKVLTPAGNIAQVVELLSQTAGVQSTIVCRPGPQASSLDHTGPLASAQRDDGQSNFDFDRAEK
jgi:diphosphomevalonate decarboxylase